MIISEFKPGAYIKVYVLPSGLISGSTTSNLVDAIILSQSKYNYVIKVLGKFTPNSNINRFLILKADGSCNKENCFIDDHNEKIQYQDKTLEIVGKNLLVEPGSGFNPAVERGYRNIQASIIIESLPNNCYAFGGYTRDMVANKPFNDIDIFVHNYKQEAEFFNNLKNKGFDVKFDRDAKYVKMASSKKYTVKKGSLSINMDVVNAHGNINVNPVTDADIDMIAMRADGSRFSLSAQTTVLQIENNITNRTYIEYNGMNSFRRQKLESYGFSVKSNSKTLHFTRSTIDGDIYDSLLESVKLPTATISTYLSDNISCGNVTVTNLTNNSIIDTNLFSDIPGIKLSDNIPGEIRDIPKESLSSILKNDAEAALYRATSNQITKRIKIMILNLLEKEKIDLETRSSFAKMLDTEFGSSFVSMMIGLSLTYAPKIKDNDKVKVLATEFRTQSIAIASNEVFNLLMNNFSEIINSNIKSLPIETKYRMNIPDINSVIDAQDHKIAITNKV